LASSTLDFKRPAFFSCLGVLVYLMEEAAYGVFRLVAAFPESSEIVFTFSQPSSVLDAGEAAGRQALASVAEAMGEPWRTHFDRETLMRRLQEMGFREILVLDPAEAQRRYFAGRRDGLRPAGRENVGSAKR
jgi:O-methyltransferase involved in polyketide biosynthesis